MQLRLLKGDEDMESIREQYATKGFEMQADWIGQTNRRCELMRYYVFGNIMFMTPACYACTLQMK